MLWNILNQNIIEIKNNFDFETASSTKNLVDKLQMEVK